MARGSLDTLLAAVVLSSGILTGCSGEKSQAVVPISMPENIVIAVDEEGNFYWNGERVDRAEIFGRLEAQKKTPTGESASTSSNAVTLEILGDGTFVWNGEPVRDAETLDRHWEAAAAAQPRPEIRIRPNQEAKYEAIARALEGAQRYGVTNLGFIGNVRP